MSDLENMPEEERNRLATTMNALLKDPAIRRETLRLIKKKNPNVPIPEIDQEDEATKAREETTKQVTELRERFEKDAMERQWAELRRSWKDRGLDPDLIQKTMTEKKIADPETAIEFLAREAASAVPTPAQRSEGGRMKLPDTFNAMMKDPKGTANDLAHAALDEYKAGKVKLG